MKLIKHFLLISVFASVFALSGANNANALQPSTPVCEFYNHNRQYLIDQIPYQNIKDYLNNSSTPVIYSLSTADYFGDNVPIIDFTYNGNGLNFYNDGVNKVRITGGSSQYQVYFNTDGSFGGLQENSIYPYTYWKCVVDVSNVTYDPSYTGTNYSTPTATDLTYQVNMQLTGSNSNFIANYSGKTTDPTSTISDPTEVRWNVTDYDIVDETSVIGTKLMCETMTKPISENFTNADCSFTRITGHRYSVIMGVYLGNATQDNFDNGDQIYNITYKMSSIELLNQSGTYTTNTTTCVNSTIGGEIGFGNNCNSTIPGLQSYLDDCINVDFPYIHVVECSSALYQTIHILTFGHINFGNSFVQAPDCRQLVMLDDWMLLPDDYILCPQFPLYVRDTITPFITLFLGMITVLWLGKIKSDGGSDV